MLNSRSRKLIPINSSLKGVRTESASNHFLSIEYRNLSHCVPVVFQHVRFDQLNQRAAYHTETAFVFLKKNRFHTVLFRRISFQTGAACN